MPQPQPLARRVLRWGTPAPPDKLALLPRFEAETRERFARLLAAAFAALVPFYAFFAITDVLVYTAHTWELLALRTALIGLCGLVAVMGRRRGRSDRVYAESTAVFGVGVALIVGMLVVDGRPDGLYVNALLGAIPLMALLPAPMAWFLGNAALVVLLYIGGMAVGGMLPLLGSFEVLGGLGGSLVFFGVAHHYLEAQRWESFVNRTRSEQLNRQLQTELATARTIQRRLLPPPTPGWASPDLSCWSEAAREVGGDFYAYIRLGARVGVAVGDVSGKGMPAALLMSTCLASLQAAASTAGSPAALLGELDRALAVSTRATRQNCALCCVELEGERLRVANAGGVAPLLRRADGSVAWVEAGGLPLGTGLSAALGYRDIAVDVGPGDLLVLVSDGVVEAMNEAGDLFGFERLEQALAAVAAPSAFAVIAELREAVAGFVGLAESHDDMTIVALKVPAR